MQKLKIVSLLFLRKRKEVKGIRKCFSLKFKFKYETENRRKAKSIQKKRIKTKQ